MEEIPGPGTVDGPFHFGDSEMPMQTINPSELEDFRVTSSALDDDDDLVPSSPIHHEPRHMYASNRELDITINAKEQLEKELAMVRQENKQLRSRVESAWKKNYDCEKNRIEAIKSEYIKMQALGMIAYLLCSPHNEWLI